MLCFHGYGMHGKQFKILEADLGSKYSFIGFDLFFHKETKLKDQSLATIKTGISKNELVALIEDFCKYEHIGRFSVLAYSMGSHYATTVVEQLAQLVDEYIVAAPMCLKPGKLITYFSKNKTGNKILEKLVLSDKALISMLKWFRRLRLLDATEYKILYSEIASPELRFNLYASFTYLRVLEADKPRLLHVLNEQNIKSIFIFGKRDKSFQPGIGKDFIAKLKRAQTIILDEGHEMITTNFASSLTNLLL